VRQKTHAQIQAEEDASWFRVPPAAREVGQVRHAAEEPERSEEDLARGRLLTDFSEVCAHFPIELYRSLIFMRQLDAAYLSKSRALDEVCRQLQASTNLQESLELRKEITELMQSSRADRAEIAAEAVKLQQLVEHHATGLQQEIRKIEKPAESLAATNLQQAATHRLLEEEEANSAPIYPKSKDKRKRSHQKIARAAESSSPGKMADVFDIPLDEHEPLYCYCNRVSFGKMLACENDACEGGQWFHFPCLGIASAPKGKWYCATCRAAGFGPRQAPAVSMQERIRTDKAHRKEKEARRRSKH
jgi:hypothetical protein